MFFASLADITGMRETSIDPAGFADVISIFNKFAREFPALDKYRASVLLAINSEFAKAGSPVHDGDEVAFFPPVSGG